MMPLLKSLRRVLGEDVIAELDIPLFNRAAIDGYAIRSDDTSSASQKKVIRLKVVDKIFPEDSTDAVINKGEAAYIACGARLPINADAVFWTEDTKLSGDDIEISYPAERWENVSRAGVDVRKGDTVLRKGSVLRPQDIGILAALRKKEVRVFRVPKVAIISIGDELTDLTDKNEEKIVNNYAIIMSGLLSELGADPEVVGVVKDDLLEIKNAIDEASKVADAVITIGGCSVGVKDFVPDALDALGKPGIIFHGVKVTPGNVTGLGIVRGRPVIMLPGRVIATVAGFYLFVAPMINLLKGLGWRQSLPVVEGELAERIVAKPGLELFLLVKVNRVGERIMVNLVPMKERDALSNLISANGYITVVEGKNLEKGEKIGVNLFDTEELTRFDASL
jgi:molybdopterin molybdotransferase